MYDVVVIGAGPGGGSAALHAARAGLSTLLLEADPEIGTPVHCGECLSDLAVQNLDLELPDHVKALDVKGIRVIFPDGTEKLLTEEGYVLEKHLFEHGYVWMIPKEGGRANVGLVTTDKRGAIKYLESFIEDTYLKGKPAVNPPWRKEGIKVRPFGGTIPISGPRTTTVGDGIMLVGDAAGFTSPLFEGGTHLALWSGREAAQTLAKALKENNLSEER